MVLNKPVQAIYKLLLPHPCWLLSKYLLPKFYQPVLTGAKKPLCCPTDEHRGEPRSSKLSSPSESLWYTSPSLPVQSQPWHLPCSVFFEKFSGCCRIQLGPFASCCVMGSVEVMVCHRKEMFGLWYKPTSVPCHVLPGAHPGSAQPRAGEALWLLPSCPRQGGWWDSLGFTGIFWDSLGFTACGCDATASAADGRTCRQWAPGPAGGAGHHQPVGSRPRDCRDLSC